MPAPSTLKINEIFWSFQGEGSRTGVPSIFLRLAGCSLLCPYCDQEDAWKRGTAMTVAEAVAAIELKRKSAPLSQVVFSGGEPQEQDISEIAEELKKKDFFLAIETNGTLCRPLPIDWWTVSPKDVGDYFIHPGLLDHIDEIKLIVNKNLDIGVIQRVRALKEGVPIFLQPDGYDKERYRNTFSMFRQCQEAGIENIRCGIQMHTVYEVK